MNRTVKKLLMLSVLGLSTSLVACEKAGELTGPSHQAPTAASAARARVKVLTPDTTVLGGDSTGVQVEGVMSAPSSGYGLGWP